MYIVGSIRSTNNDFSFEVVVDSIDPTAKPLMQEGLFYVVMVRRQVYGTDNCCLDDTTYAALSTSL